MSQQTMITIPDKRLFEQTDLMLLETGILLGRICQQEPTKDTEAALFAVSQSLSDISTIHDLKYDRKQTAYPEQINRARNTFIEECKNTDSSILIETAREDYIRLLVGIGDPLAAPWESVYQSSERSIFQASTLDVRRWYHAYGLQCDLEYREPDDHIGLILEFICLVIRNQIQSAMPEVDTDKSDCLSSFIQEHFLSWVEVWNTCIQQNARTSYYKALSWEIILISIYLQNLLQS